MIDHDKFHATARLYLNFNITCLQNFRIIITLITQTVSAIYTLSF